MTIPKFLFTLALLAASVSAHPGSSIVADAEGNIHFVDTGGGVWTLHLATGKLVRIHTEAFHWMAIDPRGAFAGPQANLGDFDGGSFKRITTAGASPALIISSDFPVTIGRDGGLYYVPFNESGTRELVRRMPSGQSMVFATLPKDTSAKPMKWVNGLVTAPDGAIYFTDNDAVGKVDTKGLMTIVRPSIQVPGCAHPLPGAPKLPYLRGLAVAPDGTIYASASGCRSVVAIPPNGPIKTILNAEQPWSPTGITLVGNDVYVLEYLHKPSDDRKDWIPRIRKVTSDGKVTTVAVIDRGN